MRKDAFVKNVGKCKREEELVCNRSDEETRVGKGEKSVDKSKSDKKDRSAEERDERAVGTEEKLIAENERLYKELQKQNIYSLRVYGRRVGVSRPTSKRKRELIVEIMKILTGTEPPSERSGRGAPPKSNSFGEEELSRTADRGDVSAMLELTLKEFTVLAELVCLGNIITEATAEEEQTRRCRELTYKICRQYSRFLNATGTKGKNRTKTKSEG